MAHRGEHTIRSSVVLSGFSPASMASVKKPPIDITQLDRCLAFYKEIPLIHEDRSICQHFLQFPSNHWPFLLFDQQRLRSVITYHKNCSSRIKTGTIFGLVLLPAASESVLGVGILRWRLESGHCNDSAGYDLANLGTSLAFRNLWNSYPSIKTFF